MRGGGTILSGMRERDVWILRAVFIGALASRLLAMLMAFSTEVKFEKFFLVAQALIADGWLPDQPFAYAPAYTYFLALLMHIGASPMSIALVQITLGALTCVAIAETTRRLFGWLEAAIAGGIAALFGPFIIQEISFESGALGLFLYSVMALAIVVAARRPTYLRWGIAGLLIGLRAVQRPDVLLILPLVIVVLALCGARARGMLRTAGLSAATCVAALLPLWPVTAMNLRAGDEIVPVMSSAGWVFYTSNNHAATGLSYYPPPLALAYMQQPEGDDPLDRLDDAVSRRLAGIALGHPPTAGESSHFWLWEGVRSIERRSFGQIGLQIKKLYYMFHSYEAHDNLALLVKQWKLGWFLLLGMGIVGPLALVGLFLAFRGRQPVDIGLWLAAALLLPPIASMSLFYVGPRFRLALAAMLMPFAAACVARLWVQLRRGELRPAAMLGGAVVMLALLAYMPTGGVRQQQRQRFIQLQTFLAGRAGEPQAAAAHYRRATAAARYPAEAEAAWRGLASIAAGEGERAEARRLNRIAEGVLPEEIFARLSNRGRDPEALWAIGRHHLIGGENGPAEAAFAEAVRRAPDDPDYQFARALAGFEAGTAKPRNVIAWSETALDLGLRFSPGAIPAYILIGRCFLALDSPRDAETALLNALRRAPGNPTARSLLAQARRPE